MIKQAYKVNMQADRLKILKIQQVIFYRQKKIVCEAI